MPGSLTAGLENETALWQQGFRAVVGVDEAGRGAWAGPVMAGAVCLPASRAVDLSALLVGVRDSKQLTARAREGLVATITTTATAWGVGSASADEITALGIVPATCLAMRRALDQVRAHITPDYLLLDSIRCDPRDLHPLTDSGAIAHRPIIRGDQLSLSIAAASILAKVTRDAHMRELDSHYPGYGFATHKGYGSAAHQAALKERGLCPVHRLSFRPMREMVSR
jgi:ribonuclease HII